ncbi:hypothetical protein STVA_11440 [Allostella vacuolata]|nr:hypothetical protein STVA_11440 [Stella vacuolata]
MPRFRASQADRVQALHSGGMNDVAIATKLQIGLVAVRRLLAPAPADRPAAKRPAAPRTTRRRIASIDGPSPVDVHVGRQVRLHRTVAGLSQTQLAESIGLTFQQVQKYERGANRISASTLTRIAAVLGVPVPAFFIGLDDGREPENGGVALRREAIELSRAYERIADTELRGALMDLFHRLGQQLPAPAEAGKDLAGAKGGRKKSVRKVPASHAATQDAVPAAIAARSSAAE